MEERVSGGNGMARVEMEGAMGRFDYAHTCSAALLVCLEGRGWGLGLLGPTYLTGGSYR